MARCGIARIDEIFEGNPTARPIGFHDPDRAAVGAVQSLLIGQGYSRLPDARLPAHGNFADQTQQAVSDFQLKANLPATGAVDRGTLRALVTRPCADPVASDAYIALALDVAVTKLCHILTFTGLFETGGRFAKLNLNTDRAGLSFGLIQWAQRPGRLNEILNAFASQQAALFNAIFGGPAESAGLLAHTAKLGGGLDPVTRETTDPRFDLVREPWISRFKQAGLHPDMQRVQLRTALAAFQSAFSRLQDLMEGSVSERMAAFLLDLANQHGEGGATSIFHAVFSPGMSQADLLLKMEQESVTRVSQQFGSGSNEEKATADRRQFFRTTNLLSDDRFQDAGLAVPA